MRAKSRSTHLENLLISIGIHFSLLFLIFHTNTHTQLFVSSVMLRLMSDVINVVTNQPF